MTKKNHNSFSSVKSSRVKFNFSGARVLVTGGTSGIGFSLANAFVDAGAEVIITGTLSDRNAFECKVSGTEYRRLELSNLIAADELGGSFEFLDVLVNNAGATYGASEFEKELLINLTAVHRLSNACLPALKKSSFEGGASIINIASMMSFFGSPYFPGYGAAKAGIVQMTKTFAALWAADGIRANAVAAGSIATRMTQQFYDDAAINHQVTKKTPLARWGEPDEIANAVLFLSSPAASFITGHTLVADGGYSITD